MNVLPITRFCNRWGSSTELCARKLLAGLIVVFGLAIGVSFWGGYRLAIAQIGGPSSEQAKALALQLERQRQDVGDAQAKTQANLDALALRLGEMQARVMRLDALGQRLTEMGKLDQGEFDFSQPPPEGGLSRGPGESESAFGLVSDMRHFTRLLDDRERKLKLLQDLIMTRKLSEEVRPSSAPLRDGYVSSGFGLRTDPFTGKKEFHEGLDFAGKPGSKVRAVAAGVVTSIGNHGDGYGNLVEIDHGDGYVSRYAHNKAILVKPGDTVSKGQPIAILGSTGRSTGPHVHLELVRNGKKINPAKFVAVN